jgi:hypothetical protein
MGTLFLSGNTVRAARAGREKPRSTTLAGLGGIIIMPSIRWVVRTILIGLITVVCPLPGDAADLPVPLAGSALAREVTRLVGELDSQTLRRRRRAHDALLQLGPDILPLLPSPPQLSGASAREAVRRVRVRLEMVKARDSVAPTRVSLVQSASLAELLNDISAQTGNRLDLSGVPQNTLRGTFSASFRERPFWSAVDELRRAAKLRYRTGPRLGNLALESVPTSHRTDEPPVAYSGAFRLAVESARTRPLVGDKEHQRLRFRITLAAEPRLRPLFLSYSADGVAAMGPHGSELKRFSPEARYELPLAGGGQPIGFDVDYKLPASVPLPYAGLRGAVAVQTAAGSEEFVFTRLREGSGVSRRRGGVTVTLRKVQSTPKQPHRQAARLEVLVSYDTGGAAFESHRTWIFHNEAYLELSDGRRIEPDGGFRTSLQADGAAALEYTFGELKGALDDYRFVYVAPTLIVNVPLSFEFKKIAVSEGADK